MGADVFVIYSFGNLEFWDQVLGAVKNVVGSPDFQTIAALFLMVGAVWKMLKMGEYPSGLQIVKLASYPVILTGLLASSVDVIIRDEILNQQRSIHNVPLIVALPAYLVTNIDRALTNLFETNFSIPYGVRYLDFGYNIGGYSFKEVPIGYLNYNYDYSWLQFTKDCLIPSISQGRIDAGELLNSPDVESVLDNVNPAYNTKYCDLAGHCQTLWCDEAWNHLKQDTRTLLNRAEDKYVTHVLTEKDIYNTITRSNFISYFTNISDYFFNYGVNLQEFIKQVVLIKQIQNGLKNSASSYSSSDDLIVDYLAEIAKPKTNQMMLALGKLAGSYIPAIKKMLIGLFIAVTPIIFLLLYIEEIRGKTLFSYFTVLLSLTLWDPLFAILNMFISASLQSHFAGCGTNTSPLSMLYFVCMTDEATTITAIAGALAWSVPTLALAIASGSSYGIVHGFGSVLGKISGGVSAEPATAEGAMKTGSSYKELETAREFGWDPKVIKSMQTQYYTEQQAARMLAMWDNPSFPFERELLDLGSDMGKVDAFKEHGGVKASYETSKYETEKKIGSTVAGKIAYTRGDIENKTKEAISLDLVSIAYNEPSKFVELTTDTKATEIIKNIMNNLPFNITESDLRATGIGADVTGRVYLDELAQKIFKPFTKGLPLQTLLNKAKKDFKGKKDDEELIEAFLQGKYDVAGKSQHQISADLKRLAGILLYERLKLERGIDNNGILTETGAEELLKLVNNTINPIRGKVNPEKDLIETSTTLSKTHPQRAWEEFKEEGKESVKEAVNKLGEMANLVNAALTAGGLYTLSKLANRGGEGNEPFQRRPRRKPPTRPRGGEPTITPTPEGRELKELKKPTAEELKERIPETTRENFRGVLTKDVLKGNIVLEEGSKLGSVLKIGGKALGAVGLVMMAIDLPKRLKVDDDMTFLFRNPNSNKAVAWQGINLADWISGLTFFTGEGIYPDISEKDINPYYAGYLLTAGDSPVARILLENAPKEVIEKSLNTYLSKLDTQKVAVIQTSDHKFLPIYIDKEGNVYNLTTMRAEGFKIEAPGKIPQGAINAKIGYYQDGKLHLYNPEQIHGVEAEKILPVIRETVNLSEFRNLERQRSWPPPV